MDILLLKDGTELEVKEGSTINGVITYLKDFNELDTVNKLLTNENLAEVSLFSDGIPKWKYKKMTLKIPNYQITNSDNMIKVSFGLRKMTEQELQEEEIRTAISYLSDEQSLTVINLYPEWSQSKTYHVGDRYRYQGILYKCLGSHDGQEDWTPEVATALWTKVLIENLEEIPEWEQPEASNGYSVGDRIIHNGVMYESLVDNNVWEPGIVGTESLWAEAVE